MNSSASVVEVNFDCLVGPTHHFGGLSFGNIASAKNKRAVSNPKMAALQGLKKMFHLAEMGFVQGILPPHERPHFKTLRHLGFSGSPEAMARDAYKTMPDIFSKLSSSSSMWAANAATVSPASDSFDNRCHISPANLVTMFHRSIEHEFTLRVCEKIFSDSRYFVNHPALPSHDIFSDEGAANHNRMCPHHGEAGLQIFVYGKESSLSSQKSSVFPARQSRLANVALMKRHGLAHDRVLNVEQNSLAIDKGAFHNDVVAVANEFVLLCHEDAFVDQRAVLADINDCYQRLYNDKPVIIEIANVDLSVDDAVKSYLFNSQLLTKSDGTMLLFAPTDCLEIPAAKNVVDNIIARDNPINECIYFDVSESMANGGGPACLRMRVPLTHDARASIHEGVFMNKVRYQELEKIIKAFYVEDLTLEHFFDPAFYASSRQALDEISTVLGLNPIYDFQLITE